MTLAEKCVEALTEHPQTARELAEKTGVKTIQKVHATLQSLRIQGRVEKVEETGNRVKWKIPAVCEFIDPNALFNNYIRERVRRDSRA
jgi:sugar-specific transcriptional regulator TrmB